MKIFPSVSITSLSEYEPAAVWNFKLPPSTPIKACVPSSESLIPIKPLPPVPSKEATVPDPLT